MKITGLMIHQAFMSVEEDARPWDMLTEISQTRYQQVADKLNEALESEAKQVLPRAVRHVSELGIGDRVCFHHDRDYIASDFVAITRIEPIPLDPAIDNGIQAYHIYVADDVYPYEVREIDLVSVLEV